MVSVEIAVAIVADHIELHLCTLLGVFVGVETNHTALNVSPLFRGPQEADLRSLYRFVRLPALVWESTKCILCYCAKVIGQHRRRQSVRGGPDYACCCHVTLKMSKHVS